MRKALILPGIALLWVIIVTSFSIVLHAQDSPAIDPGNYPTIAALEATELPVANPVSLAMRYRGVTEIHEFPTVTPDLPIGIQRSFWVAQLGTDIMFEIDATLRVSSETIHFWVQNGANVDENALRELGRVFDTGIYQQVRDLWGSELTPGIDGDPRIHALFAFNLGNGVAAYYGSRHSSPAEVLPTSNEMEMFFVNLSAFPDVSNPFLYNTLAHEFQHMIRNNVDGNEDSWMDEGYSTFTEAILGFGNPNGTALAFMAAPGTQLNTWTFDNSPSAPHYGAAFMMIAYIYEQFGEDAIRQLSADPTNGLQSIANLLDQFDGPRLDDFFADWVIANYTQATLTGGGRFDYALLDGQIGTPASTGVMAFPFSLDTFNRQYSTSYYRLTIPDGTTAFDIALDAPTTTPLVPTNAASGQWMWYSNRGDGSNPTLTRPFDLSGVDSATLQFKSWYSIEEGWDYAYVSASSDGGATWVTLPVTNATDFNPQGYNYGVGYTGDSGGWIDAEASLDAFIGSEVMVRFEMVTDDAVNQPGIVIDDIGIPEIGYFTDLEADEGGWLAEGWVHVDNVLPQQIWIQAAQVVNGEVTVNRALFPAENALSVPVLPAASEVIVAISPFAPVTTVPATYTLEIAAR